MLLSEPPPTQGDLHFRLFGIPIRVHPFFWVTTALLGLNAGGDGTPPGELLMWVAVVFVSILVHELGHAFTQRRFGGRPWITLYGLGGLASCDDCDPSPRSQILISLAGPAAGFALALVTVASLRMTGRTVGWTPHDATPQGVVGVPLLSGTLFWSPFKSWSATVLFLNILWVNIFWGLINLLPVYPLDGGRVARELLTLRQPRRGIDLSLQLSIATAAAVAVVVLLRWQQLLTALLFAYLAYANYQTLQAYRANRW